MKFKKFLTAALTGLLVLQVFPAVSHAERQPAATAVFYDYEQSEKANKLSPEYFLFGCEDAGLGEYNSWSADDDGKIFQGLVEDELNRFGVPELAEQTFIKGNKEHTKKLRVNGAVNGKLFDKHEALDGEYNVHFAYNRESGRYEYDSKDEKMLLNKEAMTAEISDYSAGGDRNFYPLDKDCENKYFGMVLTIPFIYSNGGTSGGRDMVLEIGGGDDIWVFADGKLVLDLGGIHTFALGSINFKTGEVKITGRIEESDSADTVTVSRLSGFDYSEGEHEVKIFYLDRGARDSRFKFSFNLADEESAPIPGPQPDQASDYAYIFGRTDTRMEANDNMRRGEASAVLYRLLKQRGDTGDFEYDKNTRPAFADLAGRWDRSSLEYMAHIGVYNKAPGQNIYPDEPVTRGEAFKLFALALGMTGETNLSPDQYAQILVDRGYVSGYEDGSLKLENNITRAEYCTIYNFIIRRDKFGLELAGGTPVTAQTYGFEDLQPSDWYYETMLKATSAYNKDGFVSLELRNERNWLDDYE